VLGPMVAPELFSVTLTLVAVYLNHKLGVGGLALFALVLIVFQYLLSELLTSQRRGDELRHLATTDELTGLANRKSFGDRLATEIQESIDSGRSFGVLLLDLDRFKEINDTLGHQYGDELLSLLGPRLADRIGPGGLVARLGGDEFAILTGLRTDREDVLSRAASDLIACVNQPIVIEDISLEIAGSVGIARFPQDGSDAQTLLRRADIAMYAAKEHRDGYRFYDASHDQYSTQRLSVLGEFRRALIANEIVVHYQPIVDLRTQTVRGAEGLVRWEHPELGLLQPSMFLQIVEQTGLIAALTRTVLNRSIAQCAAWRRQGLDLTVAVNLSVRNLLDGSLPHEIERMLRRHSLAPEALQLEITESMIMSDPERALLTVQELSDLGVKLAVDDFGTGHSSLANLKRLPIDELKIDRSFVTPMLEDESDLIIVRSTINMGHDLGLTIIAEGVEDAHTLERLDNLGCDLAQGHHLSQPMAPDDFADWIQDFYATPTDD
jgi:diguanylate cyclase (GGDEF)-like protein